MKTQTEVKELDYEYYADEDWCYDEMVEAGHETRIAELRHCVHLKSVALGEDVMPHDVANIMMKAVGDGKFKNLLQNGFVNCFGKMMLMIDIYEGLGGYEIPAENRAMTMNNLSNYF